MKKKILVVDDDADNSFSLKVRLEKLDPSYEVRCVDSGQQCLALLRDEGIPDLILLDIMMPEMSGWETFDKIRGNPVWRTIPVVFLTARVDDRAKIAGSFLGDEYIEKPYEIQDLKNKIDKLLENKH
jgi:putative two-component system response regulator